MVDYGFLFEEHAYDGLINFCFLYELKNG